MESYKLKVTSSGVSHFQLVTFHFIFCLAKVLKYFEAKKSGFTLSEAANVRKLFRTKTKHGFTYNKFLIPLCFGILLDIENQ